MVLRSEPARKTAAGRLASVFAGLRNSKELLLTIVAVIVAWIAAIEIFDFHPIVLPSPGAVLAALGSDWEALAQETAWSFYEMMLGFALGGSLGFALAVGIFYSPFLHRAAYPFLFGFRVVPKIAFLPLFLVWFGIGLTVKVVMAGMAVFFLMLVQTLLGLSTVDPALVELGRSLKMNEWMLLRRIRVPAALPAIMVGVKLGITYALTNVVVAEMVVSTRGLGFLVIRARQQARTDSIIAVILVTAVVGVAVYKLGQAVERRTTFWYVEEPTP